MIQIFYHFEHSTYVNFFKALRKLHLSKKNVEGKYERRDIIEDYVNYGSTVFAPLTRSGVFPDSKQDQYIVQSSFLSTYDGKYKHFVYNIHLFLGKLIYSYKIKRNFKKTVLCPNAHKIVYSFFRITCLLSRRCNISVPMETSPDIENFTS